MAWYGLARDGTDTVYPTPACVVSYVQVVFFLGLGVAITGTGRAMVSNSNNSSNSNNNRITQHKHNITLHNTT